MPTERLSMRKTREILRLKWQQGCSHRAIARALAVGVGTASEVAARARRAGLTDWAAVAALSEEELELRVYRPLAPSGAERDVARPRPDPARLHLELRRPGVTLRLLHEEYLGQHPTGYGYTRFVALYRQWADWQRVVMRQIHRAGEKCFVDYAGKRPWLVHAATGERYQVELFVAVLGASNYTWAEATATQRSADWLGSHVRLVEHLGGVPAVFVPDQLKAGVVVASRYEPAIQRTYEEWSQHYQTTILPARPASPRDKAKVEGGVLIAERWILGRLRNLTFFSLEELNSHIAALLVDLNGRVMRRYNKSRRDLFAELDQPALAPLPAGHFIHGDWSYATVGLDYHVIVDHHAYSVPYGMAGEAVECRRTAATVEIFAKGVRRAAHVRSQARGGATTDSAHMPAVHRKYREESVADLTAWAERIGPCTLALVRAILDERRHPEHGFRSCRGLRSLGKRYSPERVEAACARALVGGARSYLSVESILRHGLDREPLAPPQPLASEPGPALEHENIRGPDYYH